MPDLSVFEVLGKPSAILHSDGLTVYERLQALKKDAIVISFDKITHCTTAFLNASIGKFIIDNKNSSKFLNFEHTTEDVQAKIELVLDNARNEKKRTIIDSSARGFLYA